MTRAVTEHAADAAIDSARGGPCSGCGYGSMRDPNASSHQARATDLVPALGVLFAFVPARGVFLIA
jgi:hypothetical protein